MSDLLTPRGIQVPLPPGLDLPTQAFIDGGFQPAQIRQ